MNLKGYIFWVFVFLLWPRCLYSQQISLLEYYGEIGTGIGTSTYLGQIGGEKKSYRTNFNFLYRKLLTDKLGVRINYEYIPLGANDSLSYYTEIYNRGFKFYRTFHEINFLLEYFFYDVRYSSSRNHLIPYVGIGMGYMLNEPTNDNNFIRYTTIQQIAQDQFWPICTIPINIGLSYRLTYNINFFSEFMYRYTTSGFIDGFDKSSPVTTKNGTYTTYNNGNDRFFSVKIGVTKTLIKKFGPDNLK
jgi:hypothetical protein